MSKLSQIRKLLEQIENLEDVTEEYPNLPNPALFRSRVIERAKPDDLEQQLPSEISLPSSLRALWELSDGIRLFEEVNYGQWGLEIWSHHNAIAKQQEFRNYCNSEDFKLGDLIIGELVGDSEFVIIRCDNNVDDHGSVVIAWPMDTRSYWPIVAKSIEEFLVEFIKSPFRKYWEVKKKE